MERSLLEGLSHRVFQAGDTVFREGEVGNCAYLIEQGRVEISTLCDGIRMVLAEMGPGDLFGEMAIIDGRPRTATVTALEATRLMIVSQAQIRARLHDADPVLRLLLTVVLERFRHSKETLSGSLPEPALTTLPTADRGDAIARMVLESELQRALEQNEFELFYQPIFDLGDRSDHGIAGFEALLRWRHPERGLLGPGHFIDVAEQSVLCGAIGRWVISEACRRQAQFAAAGGEQVYLSINLSARQFTEDDFAGQLAAIVQATGADPGRLTLEITERLLLDFESAQVRIEQCRAQGFQIALDDFGTGYSSLSCLHRLPIDTLKIDRSFVNAMLQESHGMSIIRAVLDLAHNLGMRAVAEGIELPAELAALRELKCGYGQGFLLARPLPLAEALARLQAGQSAAA